MFNKKDVLDWFDQATVMSVFLFYLLLGDSGKVICPLLTHY